jgi:hypothetical protein
MQASMNLRYISDLFHEKASDEIYRGYAEEYSIGISLTPSFLITGASLKIKNILNNEIFENYTDTGYSAGLKSRNSKIIFEKKDTFTDSMKISDSIRLEAGCRREYMEIYILGKVKNSDSTEKSFKARMKCKRKNISLFSEFSIINTEKNNAQAENSIIYSTGLEVKF